MSLSKIYKEGNKEFQNRSGDYCSLGCAQEALGD